MAINPDLLFLEAVADTEHALADTMDTIAYGAEQNSVSHDQLKRFIKLLIKKEIVLEFLLEEFYPIYTALTPPVEPTEPEPVEPEPVDPEPTDPEEE